MEPKVIEIYSNSGTVSVYQLPSDRDELVLEIQLGTRHMGIVLSFEEVFELSDGLRDWCETRREG